MDVGGNLAIGEGGFVAVLLDPAAPEAAALANWAMAAFYRTEIVATRAALEVRLARGRPALLIVSESLVQPQDFDRARLGALVMVVSAPDPAALGALIASPADDVVVLPTTKAEFVLRCRRAMGREQAMRGAQRLEPPPQDPLTGALTRAALQDVVAALRPRAQQESLPLQAHVFTVRGIRRINESLGRAVGDRLLTDFADRLRKALPARAVLLRIGGHEFAVLDLATSGVDETSRYRDLLMAPFDVAGESLHAEAQVGHALGAVAGEPAESLLARAAAAMSGSPAQQEGVPPAPAEIPPSAQEAAPLRAAVLGGELRLHYQRQIDLDTGAVAGVETLLRWQRPGTGLLLPASFLPLARRAGMLDELTRWVLGAAIARAGELPRLSINVSATEIVAGSLLRTLEGTLRATGFARERLDIEIPFAVLEHGGAALAGLAALQDAGIGVTLETPGEVLTNTLELSVLPVRRFKFDPAFMETSRSDFVAARARAAGIALVCGGIENPRQLAQARALGCIEAQGHYLGYPQSEP